MAYQVLDTNLLQSAIKAASQVTAALITVGDEDAKADYQGTMNTIADDLFQQLKALADADNARIKEEAKTDPAPRRGGFGGGGGGAKRGSFKKPASDGALELSWGAFKGKSIAEIYEMDETETAQYGYETGSGKKYVNWLSNNKNNQYVADHAKAFLDGMRGGE